MCLSHGRLEGYCAAEAVACVRETTLPGDLPAPFSQPNAYSFIYFSKLAQIVKQSKMFEALMYVFNVTSGKSPTDKEQHHASRLLRGSDSHHQGYDVEAGHSVTRPPRYRRAQQQ